jgi:chorismate synthase
MAGNTFGKIFRLTTFGESHGNGIGGIIDGCPAGLNIEPEKITLELSRRKPGQSVVTSDRKEADEFEILSGIFEGKSTGSPIAFLIRNKDNISSDYENLKDTYRPSHADYTYQKKYGIRDYRGGGRSSARETVSRVFGGAIAKQLLAETKMEIKAFVSQVGKIKMDKKISDLDLSLIEDSMVRCPDLETSERMIQYIEQLKEEGDSTGGIIHCIIKNPPIGLGEPVFDKLHADLGKSMLSINAVHAFDFGSGFDGVEMKGSEHNDKFQVDSNGKVITSTNYSGGIQGGISNGMDIYFRVGFKPVSTIRKEQHTINDKREEKMLTAGGRHDPCVVPRAVPIVEAMAALVLADHYLKNKTVRLKNTNQYY